MNKSFSSILLICFRNCRSKQGWKSNPHRDEKGGRATNGPVPHRAFRVASNGTCIVHQGEQEKNKFGVRAYLSVHIQNCATRNQRRALPTQTPATGWGIEERVRSLQWHDGMLRVDESVRVFQLYITSVYAQFLLSFYWIIHVVHWILSGHACWKKFWNFFSMKSMETLMCSIDGRKILLSVLTSRKWNSNLSISDSLTYLPTINRIKSVKHSFFRSES